MIWLFSYGSGFLLLGWIGDSKDNEKILFIAALGTSLSFSMIGL
jgi:hypothetical protein